MRRADKLSAPHSTPHVRAVIRRFTLRCTTDEDFTHTTPLDATGNALGPFATGQVVKVRTLVSNSASTCTTAARTITIRLPIL